jgi:Protein of unknown function (DUF2606)
LKLTLLQNQLTGGILMRGTQSLFYSLSFLLIVTGCNQQPQAEKVNSSRVIFSVVEEDLSPVQNLQITLVETGENAPEIGKILEPTNKDGETETDLEIGTSYEAALLLDDKNAQYERFTVSEDEEDNKFKFVLEK